jgi:hypothetical protein
MKNIFTTFLLLSAQVLFAQQSIYITINNDECHNCLNQIDYVHKLDTLFNKVFIFESRFKKDSAFVLKKLGIAEIPKQVFWSDSLYNTFRMVDNGYSSTVSLCNKESNRIYKTSLRNLGDNIGFFNSINRPADTLIFKDAIFGSSPLLYLKENNIYSYNQLTKSLDVYDRSSLKHGYTAFFNDSLALEAYKMKYGKRAKQEYEAAKNYCTNRHYMDQNTIHTFCAAGDTLYALYKHYYLYYYKTDTMKQQMDTGVSGYFSLVTYKNGKILSHNYLESYLDFTKPDQNGITKILKDSVMRYMNINDAIIAHDTMLYVKIISTKYTYDTNNFLALYSKSTNGVYEVQSLYDRDLPKENRELGYGYLFPPLIIPYSYPYISTFLSDHLFSLDPKYPDIEMGYFDKIGKIKFPRRELGVWDLKVTDQFVYMIYMNTETKYYNFLKWDRASKSAVADDRIQRFDDPSSFITTPKLDDFDHNYVYIPYSDSSMIRKRFGK